MTNSPKIALVTGCSGFLGKIVTESFLNNNYKVYGIDIKKIKFNNKNFFFYKTNINIEKNVIKILKIIFLKEKKIDIILNNATYSPYSNFKSRSKEEFEKTININLYAPFLIMKNYYNFFCKYKNNSGKIINIASIYGSISPNFEIYKNKKKVNSEVYGASKAGIIQMTKYFANIFATKNISVNSISPSGIQNDKAQSKDFIKRFSKQVPMKRMANPLEVAELIIMLSSLKTNYLTGQNIIFDGALSVK
jgi:gluconate 5-dehydrogenase